MQTRLALSALLALAAACSPRPEHVSRRYEDTPTADQRQDQITQLKNDGATAKLRLLETTDLHVNMESFDYYKNAPVLDAGLVRTAVLLRTARGEVQNSLTIDNGDLIQGSPLGDWFQQKRDPKKDLHTVYKAMNLLGYDAANIGNHEFNYGLDFLEATLTGAKFPYINANVHRADGSTWLPPYTILERKIVTDDGAEETVKVGVIGFAPPQVMNWDRSNLLGKLTAADIVDAAAATIPQMQAEGADIIVAVPHSGINATPRAGNDENAVYYLATQVPGIDAILCGHSHQVFPSATYANLPKDTVDLDAGTINKVPTVMAGFWGSHVGQVDLTLQKSDGKWHVTAGTAKARAIKEQLSPGDFAADVRDAVKDDHASTLAYLGTEVGATEAPIHSYFSQIAPSSAVQLINDAQLWYAQKAIAEGGDDTAALKGLPLLSASAPLKAGGSPTNFTDVPAGKLTLRSVADLYVYPNTVRVVKITGADVANWLEMAAAAFNQIKPNTADRQDLINTAFPAYNFDQLTGVTYAIDLTQPARYERSGKLINPDAHRIVDLKYGGQPVDPAAPFLVVTNNYRANGGGQFPGLDGTKTVLDPGRESREALRDYVESRAGIVTVKVEQNWRILPVAGATDVVFKTGSAAADRTAEIGALVDPLGTEADGWAAFKLKW
jgi:2',3'-cyclic-nucleotide 2'-phosphodiesterase/3'-nucleotidase